MKLDTITFMHQVTAQDGEVAYLWRKHGTLTLYGTKRACYVDQLRIAKIHFNAYVRNVKAKRDAAKHVQALRDLIEAEPDIF